MVGNGNEADIFIIAILGGNKYFFAILGRKKIIFAFYGGKKF